MHEPQILSAVLALEFEGARHYAVRLVLERGMKGSFGGMFVE
jgi:hypothetical protein